MTIRRVSDCYQPDNNGGGAGIPPEVLKHIFTSPSSATHERAKGARSGNAKIHKMKTIEAEHIAYAAMQARFMFSSAEKWSDQDGLFDYTDYYYRIIRLIRETKDRAWANSLVEYYNEKIFGNPKGVVSASAATIVENGDDDLLEMERQFEQRETASAEPEFPSRPFTPPPVDLDLYPTDANTENHSRNTLDDENGLHDTHEDLRRPSGNITEAVRPSSQPASAGPPSSVSTSSTSTMVGNATSGPGPSTLKRRKQLAKDLFDDGAPLTESDEGHEPEVQPVKKRRGGRASSRKATAKTKTRHTKA